MFCTNCGSKIEATEKFCTKCGQSASNEKNGITTAVHEHHNFFVLLFRVIWKRKNKIKGWVKNIFLFFCVYFLSLAVLNGISGGYYSDDNTLIAFAPTILIIYIWRKITKRFDL